MFEKLVWKHDRVLVEDLVFRLEPFQNDHWELGERCFRFYKQKELIDEYQRLWSARPDFRPQNMLELGIWDGGSVAMWFQLLAPKKLVALDIQTRGDSDYFRQYVTSRRLKDRIKTYWGFDQADSDGLRALVAREFAGPLDMVIDDASHLYEPTKASFAALFPLLRPGGLYVIEDWPWGHWEGYNVGPAGTEPTYLVFELLEAIGSKTDWIAELHVFSNFIVIERGPADRGQARTFKLEDLIYRRPEFSTPTSDLAHALHPKVVAAESELASLRPKLKWHERALAAVWEINSHIPADQSFLLIDDEQLGAALFAGHKVLPFPERNGQYGGPPADDEAAVAELERLRATGANFLVFAFPAFWWLDYYASFYAHVRLRYPCRLENDRLLIFDLERNL